MENTQEEMENKKAENKEEVKKSKEEITFVENLKEWMKKVGIKEIIKLSDWPETLYRIYHALPWNDLQIEFLKLSELENLDEDFLEFQKDLRDQNVEKIKGWIGLFYWTFENEMQRIGELKVQKYQDKIKKELLEYGVRDEDCFWKCLKNYCASFGIKDTLKKRKLFLTFESQFTYTYKSIQTKEFKVACHHLLSMYEELENL